MTFAERAVRLAGIAGIAFGWTPDAFWHATPDELAALVRAVAGDAPATLARDELHMLMGEHPDG